jgi:hypothetical protein
MSRDLVFLGVEPVGHTYYSGRDMNNTSFGAPPYTYFKDDKGNWVWEKHCGHFSDGTVRLPWVDAEWTRRWKSGDETYHDRTTYDHT